MRTILPRYALHWTLCAARIPSAAWSLSFSRICTAGHAIFWTDSPPSLALADALIVTDIYAAREAPVEGVHAADIVTKATTHKGDMPAVFLPDKNDIPNYAPRELARPGDLCVFLGAGRYTGAG